MLPFVKYSGFQLSKQEFCFAASVVSFQTCKVLNVPDFLKLLLFQNTTHQQRKIARSLEETLRATLQTVEFLKYPKPKQKSLVRLITKGSLGSRQQFCFLSFFSVSPPQNSYFQFHETVNAFSEYDFENKE